MFVSLCIVSGLLAVCVVYALIAWLLKKDDQIEKRRKVAIELAAKLSEVGLVKLPRVLVAYAVGDYSGLYFEIKSFARLATSDPTAFMAEFEKVYDRVLTAKLATADGRTLLAAKLAEASTPPVVVSVKA